MITSSEDGQVKIWNFSNGETLNKLVNVEKKPQVDTEITSIISIYDSRVDLSRYHYEQPKIKNPCFMGVGWDKKLHIWEDPAYKTDVELEEEEFNNGLIRCTDFSSSVPSNMHQ